MSPQFLVCKVFNLFLELNCPNSVPRIGNAKGVVSDTFLGAKATYTCDLDYVLQSGSHIVTCLENEEWEEGSTVCTGMTYVSILVQN